MSVGESRWVEVGSRNSPNSHRFKRQEKEHVTNLRLPQSGLVWRRILPSGLPLCVCVCVCVCVCGWVCVCVGGG